MSSIRRRDLKAFQERAASELAGMIQEYPSARFRPRYNPETGELLPFLCRLRAITGAGKTPILALTALHLGPGIVLWTTNRGAVISQTLANLRAGGKYAELLPLGTQVFQLGEMTPADWELAMSATEGLTILLSTVAAFNQDSDNLRIHKKHGDFTRWQMLGGADGVEGGRIRPLYVFYDEGHGVTERQFEKLREISPKAFVLASASPLPEDLADLLSGKTPDERRASLAQRTVNVSTKEVVGVGLLKSRLYFVDCNTAQSDAIREAQGKWAELAQSLGRYKKTPIACFIVNDTSRGVDIWEQLVRLGVSPAKIAVHLNGARDVMSDRHGASTQLIDTYSGKRPDERSPEALAAAGYSHIIWNLTLREGWDEPLAYVAYIDDRGRSAVDMVQKIGRFVRQPDATPFDDPDLNSAYFYFNVTDEAFTQLLTDLQAEMEVDGYEIIPVTNGHEAPITRTVSVRSPKTLPLIAPWFGDRIQDLDQIILDAVPLFAEQSLRAEGVIRTRVFEMAEMQEDVGRRREARRDANETITPWDFLCVRLGAIDSRIINENGTIFSATLKEHEKLRQPMQFGSDAMGILANAVPQIRDRLDEKFQLRGLGKHGLHEVKPFKLISPDIEASNEAVRQRYKVRGFNNSLHEQYNGFNAFELRVAEALDATGRPWARNPVGRDGFRVPIPGLGSDTIWFYPDFLFWSADDEVWAIDPKGRHLLEAAVSHKLLDFGALKNVSPTIKVAFILDGSYDLDQSGGFVKAGRAGITLVRKQGVRPRATTYNDLGALVKQIL